MEEPGWKMPEVEAAVRSTGYGDDYVDVEWAYTERDASEERAAQWQVYLEDRAFDSHWENDDPDYPKFEDDRNW